MKIAIIGADGQLGADLCKVIPKQDQIPLTVREIDITNRKQTLEVLKKYSPGIVINTAAYHRVDDCEDHVSEAFAVNTVSVKYLAETCRKIDAALVHLSTDYVFDGEKNKPYVETDAPNPRSAYGISKLAGEYCVKYLLNKYFIVRSTGLYGAAGCMGKGGGNFVDNIISKAHSQQKLMIVNDEFVSPTYTVDLAEKICELIETGRYGLYHIVNQGSCSWYEYGKKVFDLLGEEIIITAVNENNLTDKPRARRPKYSVLASEGIEKIGLKKMRPWDEALRAYLLK